MKLFIPNKNYSLIELYDTIATTMGLNTDLCRYDCRKIEIASNLQDNIYRYYIDENSDKTKTEVELAVTMMLALSGPKINKQLQNNQVKIYDGFIVKENS